MKQTIYYTEVDHEKKTVTLGFLQEKITAHSLKELKILADVTSQLSQELNKLLQSGLEYEYPDADYEANDLEDIAFLFESDGDKHKHEK